MALIASASKLAENTVNLRIGGIRSNLRMNVQESPEGENMAVAVNAAICKGHGQHFHKATFSSPRRHYMHSGIRPLIRYPSRFGGPSGIID